MGGLLIAPDTSITVSTRGNRCEHSGIWYNLEGYYKYYLNASSIRIFTAFRSHWTRAS